MEMEQRNMNKAVSVRKTNKFIDSRWKKLVIRHSNGNLCGGSCRLGFMKYEMCDIVSMWYFVEKYDGRLLKFRAEYYVKE